MDLFIGEINLLNKGMGQKIIRKFINTKISQSFKYCIVDPDINNTAAIKCYENLNFKEHAIIKTTDVLGTVVNLKLMLLKL